MLENKALLDDPLPHLWCPAKAILQGWSLATTSGDHPNLIPTARQQQAEQSTRERLGFHGKEACRQAPQCCKSDDVMDLHSILISRAIYTAGQHQDEGLDFHG